MQRIERFGNNTDNNLNNKKAKIIEHLSPAATTAATMTACPATATSYTFGSQSECSCPSGKVMMHTTGNGTYPKNYCSATGLAATLDSNGTLACVAGSGHLISGGSNRQYWCVTATPSGSS